MLSPIPRWWALWIKLSWPLARRLPIIGRPLHELRFIHFARWAVIRRGRARQLLFLTSFDGSSIQYIDAFVRVVPRQITGLYGGATGFPGPKRFGPVKQYIDDHSHRVDHFWLAYPEASTRMVEQALALKAAYDKAAPRLDAADEETFGPEWRRFLTEVQGDL